MFWLVHSLVFHLPLWRHWEPTSGYFSDEIPRADGVMSQSGQISTMKPTESHHSQNAVLERSLDGSWWFWCIDFLRQQFIYIKNGILHSFVRNSIRKWYPNIPGVDAGLPASGGKQIFAPKLPAWFSVGLTISAPNLLQVEEGNVEYKVSSSEWLWYFDKIFFCEGGRFPCAGKKLYCKRKTVSLTVLGPVYHYENLS